MKNLILLSASLFLTLNTFCQTKQEKIRTLTQEQYQEYFLQGLNEAQVFPTNDVAFVLPTHEKDSALQRLVNEHYLKTIINISFVKPSERTKIITDVEALKEDLSNYNVWAFGTKEGNLWIAQFLKKAADFPVKITKDSIIGDKVYHGNDLLLIALWYNPDNYKRPVALFIPQRLEDGIYFQRKLMPQFQIYKKDVLISEKYYFHLKNNCWTFAYDMDTSIMKNIERTRIKDNFDPIGKYSYKYPTADKLKACLISQKELPIDHIKIEDINERFDNISDMKWLKPIAKQNKIIALGEEHHLRFNKYLMFRILFALNTFDYYPLLVCEYPYSWSGFINHYILLTDDREAQAFKDSVLMKYSYPIFDHIREWNKKYPDKKIHVGCSDIEHNYQKTINVVLNPYFKKVNPNASLEFSKADTLRSYFLIADQLTEQAKKENIVGIYPFMTAQYIENVLANLHAVIQFGTMKRKQYDHTERFKFMTRNVTDELFLGKEIRENKAFFYGGNAHFRTRADRDLAGFGEFDKTEGYYLANTFSFTKGKVYSICLSTLSHYLEDSVRRIDPRLDFTLEASLLKLYKDGVLKLNQPVIGLFTTELEKYIFKMSYQYPGCAIRIKEPNMAKVYKLKYTGRDRMSLLYKLGFIDDFDTNIYIPHGPIGD